ncbi:mechanosensitive ion channel [Lentisphaera marina]|uniref:mechanosensitive ion channel domain-containing protein n=1 Tax=Lentisphaera marina TaxID=1111041 RepID=UPI002365A855|nr:mechanosensitive ion channel domain-containing protein [Lentisphaera marina]MDD7983808.1 mechanosensitive ion channel [Lentisphaera marina]
MNFKFPNSFWAFLSCLFCVNLSLLAQSSSLNDISQDLKKYEEQVSALKAKKDSLDTNDQQDLQNLETVLTLIKDSLSLNQQIIDLDEEVKLAPKVQKELEEKLAKFKALQVDKKTLDKLPLVELETSYKNHKEYGFKLKKELDLSKQNLLNSQKLRDSIQDKILKNVERLSLLNKKSSEPGKETESRKLINKYEIIKLDTENQLFRLQQNSFSTLNKRRNAQKSLLESQYANFIGIDKFWSSYILKRRSQAVRKQEKIAISESQKMLSESPEIKLVFDKNIELLKKLKELNQLRSTVNQDLKLKNEKFETLKNNFTDTKDMLSRRILNEVVGVALRQKFARLDDLSKDANSDDESLVIMSNLERDMLAWREALKELNNIPQLADKLLEKSKNSDLRLKEKLLSAYSDQQNYIIQIQDASQLYFDKIHALHALNEQINLEVDTYKTYIKGHLFWIPSSQELNLANLTKLGEDFQSVSQVLTWEHIKKRYASSWNSQQNIHRVFIFAFLSLIIFRIYYLRIIEAKITVSKNKVKKFSYTLKSFLITVALSLVIPCLFYYLSFALTPLSLTKNEAAVNISHSFKALAFFYFFAIFFVHALRPKGLGIRTFSWDAKLCEKYYKLIRIWLYSVAPFVFLGQLSNKVYDEHIDNISKLGIIGNIMIVLIMFIFVFIKKNDYLPSSSDNPRANKFIKLAYFSSIISMISILTLAFQGYFYSAFVLKNLIVQMGVHCIIVFFLSSIINSYLLSKRQKLAEGKVRKTLAIKETEKLQLQHEVLIEQEEKILENEMCETRRGFSSLVKILFIAGTFYIWQVFFPALNILDQYQLWDHTVIDNETSTIVQITVKNLLIVFILVIATFYCSSALPNILKVFILNKLSFDQGQKFTIVTILQYLIFTAGLFYAFEKLGLNWSELQWLVAALSVGLGFGLQEIVANFVSGLIVLFERPYRVGDIVTVGQTSGTVSKIQIRATTIRDWDRRELIIPNKSFITGEFINWSLSDSISRVVIALSIALDSDVQLVHKILKDIGDQHENTLDDPAPQVFMTNMSVDGFDFDLRVFVPASKYRLSTKDQLLASIYQKFNEHGIKLAKPGYSIELQENNNSSLPIEKPS